jgi:hypothetical protein
LYKTKYKGYYEYPGHFKILPSIHDWGNDSKRIGVGVKVEPDFVYCSDNNKEWMSIKNCRIGLIKTKIKLVVYKP